MNSKYTKQCYRERHIFFVLISVIVVLSGAYIYFVSSAVAHVVVRKEVGSEITRIQAQISTLEAEYIVAKDAVAEEMAFSRGFLKNEEKIFVAKKATAMVLSRNDER